MSRWEGRAVLGPIGNFPMPRWLYPQPPREYVHHKLEDMKPGLRKNWKPKRKRKA